MPLLITWERRRWETGGSVDMGVSTKNTRCSSRFLWLTSQWQSRSGWCRPILRARRKGRIEWQVVKISGTQDLSPSVSFLNSPTTVLYCKHPKLFHHHPHLLPITSLQIDVLNPRDKTFFVEFNVSLYNEIQDSTAEFFIRYPYVIRPWYTGLFFTTATTLTNHRWSGF